MNWFSKNDNTGHGHNLLLSPSRAIEFAVFLFIYYANHN